MVWWQVIIIVIGAAGLAVLGGVFLGRLLSRFWPRPFNGSIPQAIQGESRTQSDQRLNKYVKTHYATSTNGKITLEEAWKTKQQSENDLQLMKQKIQMGKPESYRQSAGENAQQELRATQKTAYEIPEVKETRGAAEFTGNKTVSMSASRAIPTNRADITSLEEKREQSERLAKERAERAAKGAEALARIEAETRAKEAKGKEQLEVERIAKERAALEAQMEERARQEAEARARAEAERLAKRRAEIETRMAEERARLEAEARAKDQERRARVEAEQLVRERAALEQQKAKERARLEAGRQSTRHGRPENRVMFLRRHAYLKSVQTSKLPLRPGQVNHYHSRQV